MDLLVNADDFGWTKGHNQAVERAHLQGILRRASLLCNGAAFDGAVAVARRCPRLGVGVHLTLCEGRPLLPPARLGALCRPDGSFHEGPGALLRLWLAGRLDSEAVRAEWRAQIERALDARLQLSHLDSHKHVHLLPPLLEVAISLAVRYRVPYLRLPLERPHARTLLRGPGWLALSALSLAARQRVRAAGLRFADRFVGFADSGALDARRLRALLRGADGLTVEVMVHPAVLTDEVAALRARYHWARRYRFEEELRALCDPQLVAELGRGCEV
ncbi:MAG: ChbG/HpnK family deacetylase [Myxococcales bacterium]|nr:ChbG/HpnK family deacetylase [Myxococcota bacterium]MDW8282003.1 ChbG/HpnK family deacetylase [Myxococcales bacterium]